MKSCSVILLLGFLLGVDAVTCVRRVGDFVGGGTCKLVEEEWASGSGEERSGESGSSSMVMASFEMGCGVGAVDDAPTFVLYSDAQTAETDPESRNLDRTGLAVLLLTIQISESAM